MTLHDRALLWWGRRHIGEMIRRHALWRALRQRVVPGMHILDAGCGRGDNALACAVRFPACTTDAVDSDARCVALLRQRTLAGRVRGRCYPHDADITTYEPADEYQYGMIYSVDVFEHLPDPQATTEHLASLLEVGGWLIVHVPRMRQRRFFKRFEHYEQHDHARDGFEPDELIALVRSSGLSVDAMRHTFGPPGAFAWELFHMSLSWGKWFTFLAYPPIWFAAWLDGLFLWKRGNGVLVVARKVS